MHLNNSINNELETNFGYPSDHQFVTMLPATEDRQTGKRLARAHACMVARLRQHTCHSHREDVKPGER